VPWLYVSAAVDAAVDSAGLLVTTPVPVPAFETVSPYVFSVNVAVHVAAVAAVIGTVHVPVPEQPPPDQPRERGARIGRGREASTLVPWLYVSVQSTPQLIPAGLLVTTPVPVPAFETVSPYVFSVNVAVTAVAAVIARARPVPEHAARPNQPGERRARVGRGGERHARAVVYVSVQSTPQLIPAGLLVTTPVPVPAFETVSRTSFRVKVAVTVVAAVIGTVHVPVPEHPPPDQPVNVELASAMAVSVTLVP